MRGNSSDVTYLPRGFYVASSVITSGIGIGSTIQTSLYVSCLTACAGHSVLVTLSLNPFPAGWLKWNYLLWPAILLLLPSAVPHPLPLDQIHIRCCPVLARCGLQGRWLGLLSGVPLNRRGSGLLVPHSEPLHPEPDQLLLHRHVDAGGCLGRGASLPILLCAPIWTLLQLFLQRGRPEPGELLPPSHHVTAPSTPPYHRIPTRTQTR